MYNNSEFLRIALRAGTYGIRVKYNGLVYQMSGDSFAGESYGLAWTTEATPEPSAAAGLGLLAGIFLVWKTGKVISGRRSRNRKQARALF